MTEAARRRTRARIRLIKIQWLLILALTVALAISVITRPSASVVEPIVEEPTPQVETPVEPESTPEPVCLGEFRTTAYCTCVKCCGSASSTINTNAMKLFLFSEQEIFGSKTYSTGNEGAQYPYFATAGNRIKHLANGTGSASWWWGRSPYASSSDHFCTVNSDGDAHASSAANSDGVCFGFCV